MGKRQHNYVEMLALLLLLLSSIPSTTAGKCLYDTLGVSKGCTSTDLKKGYRKQCLQHHPDKGGNEDKFKEVTRAYDILSDDTKRKTYDLHGEAAVNGDMPHHAYQQQQPGQQGTSFFSFGQGGSPRGAAGGGGGPHFSSFNFAGMDAGSLFGSATSRNKGTGGLNMDLSELLRQMGGGQGGVNGGGGPQQYTQGSSGRTQKKKPPPKSYSRACPCTLEDLATGANKKMKVKFAQRSKVYTIKVQKGWKAGTKVKFNASKDGRFGPITFVIQEKKHPRLERRGDDLVYRHDLSSISDTNTTTAARVVKLELVLPDGEVWTRALSKSSSFLRRGQTLTVTDKGMPIKGGPTRGNLIIEFFDSSVSKNSSSSRSDTAESAQQHQTKAKQQPS